jgi:quinol monooxygenase YgiN
VLVLAGSVRIDPAKRNDVVEATIEVMQESREMPGCISFVFAADLEDPGVLHVFQEWESPEALNRHLTAPRVEAVRLRLGSLGVREIAVQRYSVQSVGPIV